MITRAADGIIAGVCAGVARRLDLEAWLVRFLFVCSIMFLGTGLLVYFLLAIALPREDRVAFAYDKRIMGVCSVLSKRADLDIGVTRFIALLLLLTSFGWAMLAYVVMFFVIPTEAKTMVGTPPQSSANPAPSQNEVSNT